ncbi:hypothetical protein L596_027016 [Steinernema carpocapsae]|uniref:Uncharacterized protein n=1 Tax=Steinernema carpocapsae TaxID=34508 RepID=A0A4U5M326_STECR|nr:hypothetical protein L596_027016 [Steinernema carpocapsae]
MQNAFMGSEWTCDSINLDYQELKRPSRKEAHAESQIEQRLRGTERQQLIKGLRSKHAANCQVSTATNPLPLSYPRAHLRRSETKLFPPLACCLLGSSQRLEITRYVQLRSAWAKN